MKHFEAKLQAQELRDPPAGLKERVLKNANVVASGVKEKENRLAGALMMLATSKWFLFLILPFLCIGSIGALAVAIEERGADDRWQDVEKMLADAGESLDFESFFAPPVPDEENFMGTPALKGIELQPSSPSLELKHQRFSALPDFRPETPYQVEGEPLDLSNWVIADANNEGIGKLGDQPEELVLKLLDADAALFEELPAAAKRPFSQPATPIQERLERRKVWELNVAHLGILQRLAKLTSLRAIAAARMGDRKLARESLEILFQCRDCAFADGTLINGLVGVTIRAILEARLPDILREECWTEDDLRWMQVRVGEGDGFEEGLKMFRGEMASMARIYDEMLRLPKGERLDAFGIYGGGRNPASAALAYLIPDGIYYRNKATAVQWMYDYAIKPLKERDVEAIRLAGDRLEQELVARNWFSFGSVFAAQAIPATGTVSGRILESEMHRRMMEAAVALERYRRAQGTFPTGLEQLVPDYLDSVPGDLAAPVSGAPVGYSREGDGYALNGTPVSAKSKDVLKFIR